MHQGQKHANARGDDVEHQGEEHTQTSQHSPTHDDGGITVKVAGVDLHIKKSQLPLLGIFVSALILLIALALKSNVNSALYKYGLVLSIVAMVVSLAGYVYYFKVTDETSDRIGQGLAVFLFVWCVIGASVMTFRGPFKITGNGYFASWAMAISSIRAVGMTRDKVKSVFAGASGSLLGLGIASIVVICAVIEHLGGSFQAESIYAFIASIITIIVVGVFFFQLHGELSARTEYAWAVFASVIWIVLASLVTFRGPFTDTGNGYFGSWGGAIVAVCELNRPLTSRRSEGSSDDR